MTQNLNNIEAWNALYANNQQMSVWPWSNLVSMSLRNTELKAKGNEFSVLEVGCGAGANIPFFTAYTNQYFAIEGSEFIVDNLKRRFNSISDQIVVGDFTKTLHFNREFDLIVDRAASAHNSGEGVTNYLSLAYDALKPKGKVIITDWFSIEHGYFELGEQSTDPFTKEGYTEGPFANVGPVHFFSRESIEKYTSKFKIVYLEHFTSKVDGCARNTASWNVILEKD